jgi:hypothetical protein
MSCCLASHRITILIAVIALVASGSALLLQPPFVNTADQVARSKGVKVSIVPCAHRYQKQPSKRDAWCILSDGVGVDGRNARDTKKKQKVEKKNWSHRESNTGRSRILAGITYVP